MDVRFYIDAKPDKTGDCPILLSLASCGARWRTTTGYKITADKWDKDKQRVKRGASNAGGMQYNIINAGLDKIRAHFGAIDDTGKRFTKDDIAEIYDEFKGSKRREKRKAKETNTSDVVTTFKQAMLRFTTEQGRLNGWGEATRKKFKTLENHVESYKPNLKMCDINEKVLNGFVVYLLNNKFNNNYVRKLSKILSWFLRWANKNEYCAISDFTPLSPKLKVPEKPVIFLEWDEIKRMRELKIPAEKQYLERVRDVFLFCCFTGLRYSDVSRLRKSDVKNDHIEVTTIKTTDKLIIPLHQYSRDILDKYADLVLIDDRALPTISNQKMNDYLKELCQLCGFDEKITIVEMRGSERSETVWPKWELMGTHCARRTFICLAIDMNIPIPTIMSITGHSDYNAMKPYIAIASRSKKEAMAKFNQKL